MTSPPIQIEPRHWDIVTRLLHQHVPNAEVWVIGSRASGRARRYSDLDLVIRGEGEVPFSTMAALADDLEQSDLPFKVDVLDWALLTPSFREVINSGKVLAQSAGSR